MTRPEIGRTKQGLRQAIFLLDDTSLDVTLAMKNKHGITVSVSANCDGWPSIVRFINDFKTSIMPSQHEKEPSRDRKRAAKTR
jgi:hypothetical protein